MRYAVRAEKPLYVETPLWADDKHGLRPDLSVDAGKEVNTGLVDHRGRAIYRLPPPVGFGRDSDW